MHEFIRNFKRSSSPTLDFALCKAGTYLTSRLPEREGGAKRKIRTVIICNQFQMVLILNNCWNNLNGAVCNGYNNQSDCEWFVCGIISSSGIDNAWP